MDRLMVMRSILAGAHAGMSTQGSLINHRGAFYCGESTDYCGQLAINNKYSAGHLKHAKNSSMFYFYAIYIILENDAPVCMETISNSVFATCIGL
jgi:hypothetical protein